MDEEPSPKTAENMEYIRVLEHRNRVKKQATSRSTRKLQAMEQGFELHWTGANEARTKRRQPPPIRTEPRKTWAKETIEEVEEEEYLDDFDTSDDDSQVAKEGVGMEDVIRAGKAWNEHARAAVEPPAQHTIVRAPVAAPQPTRYELALAASHKPEVKPSFDDDDDEVLRLLTSRCRRLPKSQQKILARLANGMNDANGRSDSASDSDAWTVRECVKILQGFETTEVVPPQLPAQQSSSLVVRVHDGWDGPRIAGLDGLAILTASEERVDLTPSDLRLFAGSPPRPAPPTSRSAAELPRLLVAPGRGDETSWIVRLPSDGPVEVHVRLPLCPIPQGTTCRLWNCSATSGGKSDGAASTAGSLGARRVEVLVNGRCAWSGELARFEPDRDPRIDETDVSLCDDAALNDADGCFEGSIVPEKEQPAVVTGKENVSSAWLPDHIPRKSGVPAAAEIAEDEPTRQPPPRREASARRRRTLTTTGAEEAPAAAPASKTRRPVEEPREVQLQDRRHENQPHKKESWSEVDAVSAAHDDALSSHQLATLVGARTKPQKETTSKPDPLQQSWDSLSYFARKNRSRLSQTGAAILGGAPIETTEVVDTSADEEAVSNFLTKFAESIEDTDNSASVDEASAIEIPTLPKGRLLRLELASTWGDPFYIGLQGIEMFDGSGALITPARIEATPPSINVLEEYDGDPRTADKLVDGVVWTCDELHSWLAPYDTSAEITLELTGPTSLSMMRIWNYNKSRADSYRGVRHLRASLDGVPIFDGEIRKAPGYLDWSAAETILFTMDESILACIEAHDAVAFVDDDHTMLLSEAQRLVKERPKTNENKMLRRQPQPTVPTYSEMLVEEGLDRAATRPPTAVLGASITDELLRLTEDAAVAAQPTTSTQLYRKVSFQLLSTWGDRQYVGLSGLELLGPNDVPVPVEPSMLAAEPRDLATLGYADDPRTLDKLVDGNVDDDRHSWIVPVTPPPTLDISLNKPTAVTGFRIFNYNREDADRGVRLVRILLDGARAGVVELRPAPGRRKVDFSQRVAFDDIKDSIASSMSARLVAPPMNHRLVDDYETLEHPRGSLLRFVFHSTHGDPFYIGLNALQIRGLDGRPLVPERVAAVPDSVRVLGGDFKNDPRVPANLVADPAAPWLAPNRISLPRGDNEHPDDNELYVFLPRPAVVADISIWNYSKTPARGAKDVSVWLDGRLLARARLEAAGSDTPAEAQTLLFTPDRFAATRRRRSQKSSADATQDVLCIDDNQVRIRSKLMFHTDVCADGVFSAQANLRRPTTSC